MGKGYPLGTKCVITQINEVCRRDHPGITLGSVFTVGSVWERGDGLVSQELREAPRFEGCVVGHRVDWMRPIDKDTDEDDQEVIRQMNTIRVRDHVTKLDPAWGEGVEK